MDTGASLPQLPSGTVTFLFSDIEGSTSLWDHSPDLMAGAIKRHAQVFRSATEAAGGHLYKSVGDSFCAAFKAATAAVQAATAAKRGISSEQWRHCGSGWRCTPESA